MPDYQLIRSARKTLSLEITPEGQTLVRAPRALARARIDAFVESHRDWIARHRQRRLENPPPPPASEAEIAALKALARQALPPKVAHWSAVMGLRPAGFKVTAARRRYGSCSGKNSLCFSCFLMNCPEAAVDLVVVHELCHIREKNHGPRFYALLERYLPDWRERKRLLSMGGAPQAAEGEPG